MNSDPHKFSLNFPMAHLNAFVSPKKTCLELSTGDTVDIDMKEIGCRRTPSRDVSNSHF